MNKTTLAVIAVLSVMTLPAIADENNANTASTKLATKTVELSDTSRVYDIDEVVVVDQPKESFRLRQQPLSSSSFSTIFV